MRQAHEQKPGEMADGGPVDADGGRRRAPGARPAAQRGKRRREPSTIVPGTVATLALVGAAGAMARTARRARRET